MGHNVNFDYNILRYNLKRDGVQSYMNYEARTLDTLKLAHLIKPRLRKYKLEFLLDALGLEGQNTHMADDDIMATYELAKYCRRMADNHLQKQAEFFHKDKVKNIIEELNFG